MARQWSTGLRGSRLPPRVMQASLVIMVTGVDRPGIVERVAKLVSAHEGNWDQSRMVRLAGRFAGVLSVTVPVERVEELKAALAQLSDVGLTVFVEAASQEDVRPLDRYLPVRLELTGSDREGIVREVSAVLARLEVNVDEISTRCREAPMAGGMLFEAQAHLRCPPLLDLDTLRGALEALSSELAVDISLADEPR